MKPSRKKRLRRHDNVAGREAAQLDSPGQRPGTKAEVTQHKAQRAVTPWRTRVTARWALDRVPGNRSPRPPAWAVEFGPVGAVARSDSPKRGTTPRPFPGSPTRSRRGAATFPQTQRRPDPPVPRGKVWAFGAIRLAASGTKTLPSNRRSFPSNRRRFSSPHAVCRELFLKSYPANAVWREPSRKCTRCTSCAENRPLRHSSGTAPAVLRRESLTIPECRLQ